MQKILVSFVKPAVIFTFFLLLSLVNFGSNLRSEFMIDDFSLIADPTSIKSSKLTDFYKHFIPDYHLHEKIENAPPAVYYRPFAHLIPFLQSLAFGMDTLGYHFTNIVLFVVACLCFYFLLFELSGDRRLAFLSATLFCLHPLNSIMSNYITASVFAAQLIFLSLTVIFYIRDEKQMFSPGAVVMFVSALLCHETSLMLPAYLFLVSWSRRQNIRKIIEKAAPFIFVAAGYLVFRFYFANIGHNVLAKSSLYTDLNAANYFATFTKLIAWYFTKFITLQSTVIIWSTPLVHDGIGLWWAGGLGAISLVILMVWRWRNNIKAIYLLWFVLGLLPLTFGSLFSPHTGMMIEPHWLFFASFGIFALVAGLMLEMANKMSLPFRAVSFLLLCTILMTASWSNNLLWKDEMTFSRHWATEAPTNKNALFCYANTLFKHRQFSEAKQGFIKSLMNDHNDWQNYNNLAAIAMYEHDDNQALVYYQNALAIFPESATVHNNLGTFYLKKNNLPKAEEFFRKAHALNPYQPEALLNLGSIFEQQGRWDQVWESYLKAFDLRPKDERVLYALLKSALKGQGHEEIIARAEEFLKEISREIFLIELGDLLSAHGQDTVSLKYFTKAIALYPQRTAAYREAGKVLANAGYLDQARKIWNDGLQVEPNDQEFKNLLEELAAIKAGKKD